MPITIGHDPSGRTYGEAAYSIGSGTRQERESVRAEEVALRQRQLSIQAASAAAAQQRGMAAQTLAGEQQEFRERVYEEAPGRAIEAGEASFRQQQQQLQSRFKLEYSMQQKREMQKIADAMAMIESSDWTEGQKNNAKNQLTLKHLGLQKNPTLVFDETPTPDEVFQKGYYKDESGNEYMRDAQGAFKPINEKLKLEKIKMYAGLITEIGPDGQPMYSPQQTRKIVEQAFSIGQEPFDAEKALEARLEEQRAKILALQPARAVQQQIGDTIDYAIENPEGAIDYVSELLGDDKESIREFEEIVKTGDRDKITKAITRMIENGLIR